MIAGPFLLGPKPTLADAALAPWLLRIPAVKHWRWVTHVQSYVKHITQCDPVAATRYRMHASPLAHA